MAPGSIASSAVPQGIILVYDITDEKSFENIQNWMKSIKEVRGGPGGRRGGKRRGPGLSGGLLAPRMPRPGWSACCWETRATWRPRGRCRGSRRTRSGSGSAGEAPGRARRSARGTRPFPNLLPAPPTAGPGARNPIFRDERQIQHECGRGEVPRPPAPGARPREGDGARRADLTAPLPSGLQLPGPGHLTQVGRPASGESVPPG